MEYFQLSRQEQSTFKNVHATDIKKLIFWKSDLISFDVNHRFQGFAILGPFISRKVEFSDY